MTQQEYPSMTQFKEGLNQRIFSDEQLAEVLLGLRYLYQLYLDGKITLQVKIQKLIRLFYIKDSSFRSLIDRQLMFFRKTNGLSMSGPIVLDFCKHSIIKRSANLSHIEKKKAKETELKILSALQKI